MNRPILVRGARQLLTLRGPHAPRRGVAMRDLGIIPDGAVLIVEGRVFASGQGRRVENLEPARRAVEIEVRGCVVMPGFVDSHAYPVWGEAALDSFEGGDFHPKGAISLNWETFAHTFRELNKLSARTLERRARLSVEEFLRHGTTTVGARTGWNLERRGENKNLRVLHKVAGCMPGVLVPVFLAGGPPAGQSHLGFLEYASRLCQEYLPYISRRNWARCIDVRCGPGACSLVSARRLLTAARSLGLALKVQAEQLAHSGAAALAVELGAMSADGLEFANHEDTTVLAESNTIATLMPAAAFHLGHGRYAPARALIDSGAAVALASGYNPAFSPTCNMAFVMGLACRRMRMTPAEAITAATVNGAWSLGRADEIGSLEAGKWADLVVLDVSDYREIAYYPADHLVRLTMKKGRILYQRGSVEWPEA